MSSLVRRIARLPSSYHQIIKRYNTTSGPTPTHVPPSFTQKAPLWVRFAWPIIIANALLMGSAVDITWNHWATLVKDLEAVGEKNKQNALADKVSPPTAQEPKPESGKKDTEVYVWEHRPTWQRAAFCGIYATGWAISTAYLLKYRQTFVTSLRFLRVSREIPAASPAQATATTAANAATPSEVAKSGLQRVVHITTASNSNGLTLPLSGLVIQDGRNETEMVIRTKDMAGSGGRKRAYWYVSLTDAVVGGRRYGVGGVRDQLLTAWSGTGVVEKKSKRSTGWKSGPVTQS